MKENLLLLKNLFYYNLNEQNLQIYDFNIKNVSINKLGDLVNE